MADQTRCPNCGAVLAIENNQAIVVPGVAIEAPTNPVTTENVVAPEVAAPVDETAPVVAAPSTDTPSDQKVEDTNTSTNG